VFVISLHSLENILKFNVYFSFPNTTIQVLYFFNSIMLHVSALYFSHQVGILVHKKSKREETSPYKEWV